MCSSDLSEAASLKMLNAGTRRFAIGLHVTLTAPFHPMSPGFRPTRDGAFLTLEQMLLRGLLRRLAKKQLALEIATQFKAFVSMFGRVPDFVDGHQHVHIFPQVREALDRMWPVLSGAELVHDLLGFAALVRSAASGILSEDEQRMLVRPRADDLAHVAWTEADVALIDEADALVGPVAAARSRRRRSSDRAVETAARVIEDLGLHGYADAATLARRFGEADATTGGDGAGEPRTFGHVLVDEAQDLTAMQWRMLARRCPSGSMTIVGDPGQASRPGAVAAWPEVLANLPGHNPPHFAELTINYRTPAEVMDIAARLLAVAAPGVAPSRSVRSTGEAPDFFAIGADALVATAAARTRAALDRTGTVAVIAPPDLHPALAAALADVGARTDAADALEAPIAVLDPTSAKGLEFDHVIVVEPARLVTADGPGLRLLYVTLTRTTKSLAVVYAQRLPEGLRPQE